MGCACQVDGIGAFRPFLSSCYNNPCEPLRTAMPVIAEVIQASKEFISGDSVIVALKPSSMELSTGKVTLIIGPSGSGKTTLLSLIGCVIYPTSGEVIIDGIRTSGLSARKMAGIRLNKIGFIFQQFNLLAPLTAEQNVMLPLTLQGIPDAEAKGRVRKVLEQVNMLLNLNGEGLCASRMTAYTANSARGNLRVLAATDVYSQLLEGEDLGNLPPEVQAAMNRVLQEKTSHYGDRHYAGYFRTKAGSESMIYMVFPEPVNSQARDLLEIFCQNVAITYDGLLQREDTESAQRSTISILGGAIEKRSSEPSQHLQRVGNIAAFLATLTGRSEEEVNLIRMAASLHDVGKASVSDHILTKPNPLTEEEWAQMKTHSLEGARLLEQSNSRVHLMGAKIAKDHHEHWDGSGYPLGLSGEAISIEGRITAIADVLDSLLCDSCYKKAWAFPQAIEYIVEQAGKQFDPQLTALLLANISTVEAMYSPGS